MVEYSHYPSPELLAAVANNPKEQRARQRVLQRYRNWQTDRFVSRDRPRLALTHVALSSAQPDDL